MTLSNEILSGRISHAYLFTGSRGTGKTTCAKIFAKAVNCENPKGGNPCNECKVCMGIDSGSVLDVLEIDAASNNGVDNIRDIRDETMFTPSLCKYRVYIIDEVHMLSINAFNALLKTLEEPPGHVIFILATTESHKLPATILSRCQRFDFRRIKAADIAQRLIYIAEQEGVNLQQNAALLIAKMADGAMRDALSMLDRCLGFGDIDEKAVVEAAGLAGRDYLFLLSEAIRTHDTAQVVELIDQMHNSSKDMQRLCEELISFYRNLLIIKTIKDFNLLIVASSEETEHLQNEAAQYSLPFIINAIDVFAGALERMQRSVNRRVVLETTLIKLCEPQLDSSVNSLLQRIDRLETAVKALPHEQIKQAQPLQSTKQPEKSDTQQSKGEKLDQKPQADMPKEPQANKKAPTKAKHEEKPKQDEKAKNWDEDIKPMENWPEVIEALRETNAPLMGMLSGTTAYIKGNTVYIKSNSPLLDTFLKKESSKTALLDALKKVTDMDCQLGQLTQQNGEAQSGHDELSNIISKAKQAGVKIYNGGNQQ